MRLRLGSFFAKQSNLEGSKEVQQESIFKSISGANRFQKKVLWESSMSNMASWFKTCKGMTKGPTTRKKMIMIIMILPSILDASGALCPATTPTMDT